MRRQTNIEWTREVAHQWADPILLQRQALNDFASQCIRTPVVVGITRNQVVACGSYACALKIKYLSDNKLAPMLLKISRDYTEGATSEVIMNAQRQGFLTGIAFIYGLGVSTEGHADGDPATLMVVEKVKSLGTSRLDREVTQKLIHYQNLSTDWTIGRVLAVKQLAEDFLKSKHTKAAGEAILWLAKKGINWTDFHEGNFGWRGKGNYKELVILDTAAGSDNWGPGYYTKVFRRLPKVVNPYD